MRLMDLLGRCLRLKSSNRPLRKPLNDEPSTQCYGWSCHASRLFSWPHHSRSHQVASCASSNGRLLLAREGTESSSLTIAAPRICTNAFHREGGKMGYASPGKKLALPQLTVRQLPRAGDDLPDPTELLEECRPHLCEATGPLLPCLTRNSAGRAAACNAGQTYLP